METQVSPIQRDAFQDLVNTFCRDIIHTQTFADHFSKAMTDTMDDLAMRLADRVVDAIGDCIDAEDVVRNSSALGELEEKLEQVVQDAVDNVSF